jgi:hypothetical protein
VIVGFMRKMADRMRLRGREVAPPARLATLARVRNELAQVRSIRDDSRIPKGGSFDQWLAGAIFALQWVEDPEQCVPPSVPAVQIRAGIATDVALNGKP